MVMKKKSPSIPDDLEIFSADRDELPFALKKEEISAEKIKKHWEKIADKIAQKGNPEEEVPKKDDQ